MQEISKEIDKVGIDILRGFGHRPIPRSLPQLKEVTNLNK